MANGDEYVTNEERNKIAQWTGDQRSDITSTDYTKPVTRKQERQQGRRQQNQVVWRPWAQQQKPKPKKRGR